jgi:hypothetical protein
MVKTGLPVTSKRERERERERERTTQKTELEADPKQR